MPQGDPIKINLPCFSQPLTDQKMFGYWHFVAQYIQISSTTILAILQNNSQLPYPEFCSYSTLDIYSTSRCRRVTMGFSNFPSLGRDRSAGNRKLPCSFSKDWNEK
jgi:hypothetical protein